MSLLSVTSARRLFQNLSCFGLSLILIKILIFIQPGAVAAQYLGQEQSPEFFVERFIIEQETDFSQHPGALEALEKFSPAKLRVIRNAVFANRGVRFESPDLHEYFTQDYAPDARDWTWYRPLDEPEPLTETDRANVNLITELEERAPERPDFLSLFEPKNALESFDTPGFYERDTRVIPAGLIRKYGINKYYPHESYFSSYVPKYRIDADEKRKLLIYGSSGMVGVGYYAALYHPKEKVTDTVFLAWSGDQEVGGEEPEVIGYNLFFGSFGHIHKIRWEVLYDDETICRAEMQSWKVNGDEITEYDLIEFAKNHDPDSYKSEETPDSHSVLETASTGIYYELRNLKGNFSDDSLGIEMCWSPAMKFMTLAPWYLRLDEIRNPGSDADSFVIETLQSFVSDRDDEFNSEVFESMTRTLSEEDRRVIKRALKEIRQD